MAGAAQGDAALQMFTDNLRWAGLQAPKQSLTIEPLNTIDRPGYFLNDYRQAMAILAKVDLPNVRLQFDAYHVQRIHADVPGIWAETRDRVAHIQVAQTPHRTEPTMGEIDYPAFFAQLDADRYAGWVSGEYEPAGKTHLGLGWAAHPA
jgi:hydroxypyruvate isomerase